MHKIRIDRINLLVEQRVSGTPNVAEVEESGAAMRHAVRSLDAGPDAHLSLYDCTDMGVIGDDAVASAFRQWNDPRFTCVRARKVAVVVPSTLTRLRAADWTKARPNMRLFATRPEAMRWLFS